MTSLLSLRWDKWTDMKYQHWTFRRKDLWHHGCSSLILPADPPAKHYPYMYWWVCWSVIGWCSQLFSVLPLQVKVERLRCDFSSTCPGNMMIWAAASSDWVQQTGRKGTISNVEELSTVCQTQVITDYISFDFCIIFKLRMSVQDSYDRSELINVIHTSRGLSLNL